MKSAYFKKIAVLMLVLINCVTGLELPSSIMRCGRKDPNISDCLKTASNGAFRALKNGLKEFDLKPVDPLDMKEFIVGGGSGSPVNLKQTYRNLKIYGMSDGVVQNVKSNPNKCKYRVDVKTPRLQLVGDYELDGKILLLPLTGRGKFNITLTDVTAKVLLECEQYMETNTQYIRAKDYKVDLNAKNAIMKFDNLFNDKALSDNMNKFINENWELLFSDMKDDYGKQFGKIFKDITNKIFTKIPENKIFLS